jgi:hypothetical protein
MRNDCYWMLKRYWSVRLGLPDRAETSGVVLRNMNSSVAAVIAGASLVPAAPAEDHVALAEGLEDRRSRIAHREV